MTAKKKKRARGGSSYLCPKCSAVSHVIVTRRTEAGIIHRSRECLKRTCGKKFETAERITGASA